MSDIIVTHDVCRNFKSGSEVIHALKKISISVDSQKLIVLRGRSGSGKTTLINILGGIDIPDSGDICFMDKCITDMDTEERDRLRRNEMGFVFQSAGLFPYMSAYENVELGLRIAGYDTNSRKKRAEECLNMLGLGKRMHHRPGELSGGEQQRVAIARAVAHKPKVVFADEPTAALDTAMGLQVVKSFKDLVEKEGITVIMSTHDPNMMDIADIVFTLQDGEIVNE